MKLTNEQRSIVQRIRKEHGADFCSLVRIANLDPRSDFRYANLTCVEFGSVDLDGFDFTGANLSGADLRFASVRGAVFVDVSTEGTLWPEQRDDETYLIERNVVSERKVVTPSDRRDSAQRRVENHLFEQRDAVLLMPKATAVWLIENTTLTFDQIADFCKLHPLEVKAIADGDAAQGIKGLDPVLTGQLTREDIEQAERDPERHLKLADPKVRLPEPKSKRGPRYTPVSRRQDRPNAILWLLRNHPELKDAQIMRLVGTTKSTIQAIRDRTHWNAPNLQPMDPVTLGLCSQLDLDFEVQRAAKEKPVPEVERGATLLPAEVTTADAPAESEAPERKPSEELDVDAVFAKLKQLGGKADKDEDKGGGA